MVEATLQQACRADDYKKARLYTRLAAILIRYQMCVTEQETDAARTFFEFVNGALQ